MRRKRMWVNMRVVLSVVLCLSFIGIPQNHVKASIIEVTNTYDDGSVGSLRWAIAQANSYPTADQIVFNIIPDAGINPGYGYHYPGVFTITLTSPLVINDDDTEVLGFTQQENQGNTNPNGWEIELFSVSTSNPVITITSDGNMIDLLCITHGLIGVELTSDANSNRIIGNIIGLNPNLSGVSGNTTGIRIYDGSDSNTIINNYIGGNSTYGVEILDSNDNSLRNNYIGTNDTSTTLGNGLDGIFIHGTSTGNTVGGVSEDDYNVISSNGHNGIWINGAATTAVAYNRIGTNRLGSSDKGNTWNGIYVSAGATDTRISNNLISGNGSNGIYLIDAGTKSTIINDNTIGLNAAASSAISNDWHGIAVYEGPQFTHIENNIIAANGWSGVVFQNANDNFTTRNHIGFGNDPNVTTLGNSYFGINILGRFNYIFRDIIAHNGLSNPSSGDGIRVEDYDDVLPAPYGNKIVQSSIFHNGGKGIENMEGANHDYEGPTIDGTSTCTHVIGHLPVAKATFVDFFSGPDDEGKTYLGYLNSNADGSFEWYGIIPDAYLTVTWEDTDGSTSEFSALLLGCSQVHLPMVVKP
ncbi:MAG: right-handed parallel beta-helix repeat-containing protein [Anaerolineaceae bacterium]|nr:right-handed parallel beta-helix repeat-containing protein [Anaerolineaceae bacterium]